MSTQLAFKTIHETPSLNLITPPRQKSKLCALFRALKDALANLCCDDLCTFYPSALNDFTT